MKQELMAIKFILEKIKKEKYGGNSWEIDDAMEKIDYVISRMD